MKKGLSENLHIENTSDKIDNVNKVLLPPPLIMPDTPKIDIEDTPSLLNEKPLETNHLIEEVSDRISQKKSKK